MDKSVKVFKYKFNNIIKSLIIFYSIFLLVSVIGIIVNKMPNDINVVSKGIEFATFIFIFIAGLEAFKDSFYFTQSNSISRKSFLKGSILYGVVISAILPIIDIMLNRIINLFIDIPMLYDMLYGTAIGEFVTFSPNNSISWLIGNYLWLVVAMLFVFLLGFLLTISFYRLNVIGKTILGCSLGAIFIGIGMISEQPGSLLYRVINIAFGTVNLNPYISIITFVIMNIVIIGAQYLLIRNVAVKKSL